jgi:hypothetical protein
MRLPVLIVAALLLLLAGCKESKQEFESAVANAQEALATRAGEVQAAGAEATVPVVLALRETVDAVAAETIPPPQQAEQAEAVVDPAVFDLVVRWEIGSQAQYVRQYQGVICPGGGSGPTIGIGYDLGTHTPSEIRAAWGWHPAIEELVTASMQVGPDRCAAWRAKHRDIRVSYDDAVRVFATHDWPRYVAMAARAYRNGWDGLTSAHQSGLAGNGYNRGFTFVGSRRSEMREIRDTCVPGHMAPCTADQLRASCRVWEGTKLYAGLCARRRAEAAFVVR